MKEPGQIVILNGAPRSGKSSIAHAIQQDFEGIWLNLGVDVFMRAQPERLQPGIGLRPGGERPDLEPFLPDLYAGLYAAIAAQSRFGFNVVADLGHHDCYSQELDILPRCARLLAGLPVLFVGVHCPIETIMARRAASDHGYYLAAGADGQIPAPVRLWQQEVHRHWDYDLVVDTGATTPQACAARIKAVLGAGREGQGVFEGLGG